MTHKILILVLCVTSFFTYPSAKAEAFEAAVLTAKSTLPNRYFDTLDYVASRLQKYSGDGVMDGYQVAEQIRTSCSDQDSLDFIIWTRGSSREREDFKFICKVQNDRAVIEERTILVSMENNDVVAVGIVSMKAKESLAIDLSLRSPRPNLLGQMAAVTVAVYLSDKMAQRNFKGEEDKRLHAKFSAGLAAAGALMGYFVFDLSVSESVIFGATASWLIGMTREVKQGILDNDPSNVHGTWSDMKANTIGALIGSLGVFLSFKF